MKQCYCLLERFNNYFNRKIIKYDNLSDYEDHSEESFIPYNEDGSMTRFDFNPNDNVMTEIIVNNVPFDPDYFLLLDEEANIVQRWFVLEQKRNRQGQWIYSLRRDVVADNLENLWNAPIFVEKGMVREDDPFIVNSEGMSFNQIKKDEIFLKDKSNTAWIVGYMARNIGGQDINIQAPLSSFDYDYTNLADIASAASMTEADLLSVINLDGTEDKTTNFSYNVKMVLWLYEDKFSPIDNYRKYEFDFSPNFLTGIGRYVEITQWITAYLFRVNKDLSDDEVYAFIDYYKNAVIDNRTSWINGIKTILDRSYYFSEEQLNILKTYNGRYVKYNGTYYKFTIKETGTTETKIENISNQITCVANTVTSTIANASADYTLISEIDSTMNSIISSEKRAIISLETLSNTDGIPELSTKISSARNITADQEFDIFAIPLNARFYDFSYEENIENYIKRISSAISLETDVKLYDLQLLPYCPIPSQINDDGEIVLGNLVESTDFDYININLSKLLTMTGGNDKIGTETLESDNRYSCTASLYFSDVPLQQEPLIESLTITAENGNIVSYSYTVQNRIINIDFIYEGTGTPSTTDSLTFIIKYRYKTLRPISALFYLPSATFTTIIEKEIVKEESLKVLSNCYMWRLCSPNYQGVFEFNIAKNGGKVSYFNVFCTYKPYTPIIKVAPNFEWLYGLEYQDNRGLLCAGDFSLPRVSDAWVNYQLNNKNYQNIFNRDIQHLDFMQGLEMRNQIVSGTVGILSDAAKGAAAGAFVGGGAAGAVVGGVLGAGASAIGYGIDVDTLARQHRENKQLAIDKYNYQLGNVKALPYTLTKVGSFDAISKIFPFIEEYCSSEKELEAFKNKIKYESMTVMRIGTLKEYADYNSDLNYFKGSLIRNDEIADDPHILNAIYEELLKGVYI